ncbi:YwiB family protein [Alkalicoccobacillus murimartini]|uniref:Uncharacterized beta-barrel protein YwiB (DUF1934 family) n=1 Tax=Alkalicoccobacillus murimartini TaxID=171685 RepID=A0ABT9YGT5_9BACI|nr:DUF1934 family protein [Alkalicoccobacillus murimartini]MDQ0207078.1 uncharacterized beta-barrel protein YwiB (DUF1934 family) [Alkalicoccobacillus murimartini]
MNKPVKRALRLTFQTNIELNGEIDSYEFSTEGELYHKREQDYLRFVETFGVDKKVQTTMKWDGEELTLIRQGDVLMRQTFVSGKSTIGRYVTPEASWETKSDTEVVLVQWPTIQKPRGKIYIRYRFWLAGQETGSHEIRLKLEERTD